MGRQQHLPGPDRPNGPVHTPPSGNISFQCNTTGALPLGPTGSGTLATVNVTGKQLLPVPQGAPPQALNLSLVTLHDISGDTLPLTTTAGTVRVVGCPDFDDNRVVNFSGDVINIARAALGWPRPLSPANIVENMSAAPSDEDGTLAGTQSIVDIDDKTKLTIALGKTVYVEDESMKLEALTGDGPGGVQDTMEVTRANPAAHVQPKPILPTEPEHDVDRNGVVNFPGDVITTAQVAMTTEPTPLRCPP